MYIQSIKKLWNCKTCGKGFTTKRERLTHRMKEHSDELEACGIPTGKKDQECPYCHKMYEKQLGRSRFRNTINRHIFHVHKNKLDLHPEITAQFTCNECDIMLYDKSHLTNHKKTVHGETVACTICSVVKSSQAYLDYHMQVHLNEVHICKLCSSEFRNALYLKRWDPDPPFPLCPSYTDW